MWPFKKKFWKCSTYSRPNSSVSHGETEEEFDKTYNLLKEIKLYKLHVFPYSKREGTLAANFEDQIPKEIKEQRSRQLIELSNKERNEYNKKQIGKIVKVLVEEKENKVFKGHTKNYIYVSIENAEEDIRNKIAEVKLEKLEDEILKRKDQ